MENITHLSDEDIKKLDKLFQFLKDARKSNLLGYFSLDAVLEQKLNETNVNSQRELVEILANSGLTDVGNINGERYIWSQSCNRKGLAFDSFFDEKLRQNQNIEIKKGLSLNEIKILRFLHQYPDINNEEDVISGSKFVNISIPNTKIALTLLSKKGYVFSLFKSNGNMYWETSETGNAKAVELLEKEINSTIEKVEAKTIIVNSGNFNYGDNVNQSLSNSHNLAHIKNKTNEASSKKSVIEILSWIVGIIVGFIAIYEFVIKKILNN